MKSLHTCIVILYVEVRCWSVQVETFDKFTVFEVKIREYEVFNSKESQLACKVKVRLPRIYIHQENLLLGPCKDLIDQTGREC